MIINYALIGEALLHPTKKAILATYAAGGKGQIFSPVGLAAELEQPLGNVSYHVKDLAGLSGGSHFKDTPLLKLVATKPRRGALEHFYALSSNARIA